MRVIWSTPALTDLTRIADYLDEKALDVGQVTTLAITLATRRLGAFPLSAPAVQNSRFRKLTVPKLPYVIVYALEADRIVIARVRHSAENWLLDL